MQANNLLNQINVFAGEPVILDAAPVVRLVRSTNRPTKRDVLRQLKADGLPHRAPAYLLEFAGIPSGLYCNWPTATVLQSRKWRDAA